MPTYLTWSGVTLSSFRRSTIPTVGALGFVPGAKPVSHTMYSSPCLIREQLNVNVSLRSLYANVSVKRWPTSVGVAPVPHSMRVSVTSAGACAIAREADEKVGAEADREQDRGSEHGLPPQGIEVLLLHRVSVFDSRFDRYSWTMPIQNMVFPPPSMSYLRTKVSLPSLPIRRTDRTGR